jgi:hypothetical protein
MLKLAVLTVLRDWWRVVGQVLALPAHKNLSVSKAGLQHPIEWGFRPASGWRRGASAQYSFPLSNGGRIHLRGYDDQYVLHHEFGNPDAGLSGKLRHWLRDCPKELAIFTFVGIVVYFQRRNSKTAKTRPPAAA